ncbi:MAG: hypothetical protein IJ225_05625 [Solobacterium sp.]|nr:hypothetical protein [Solobacterium sp.]
MANIRNAYAEVVSAYLSDNSTEPKTVKLTQTVKGWKTAESNTDANIAGVKLTEIPSEGSVEVKADATGKVTIGGVTVPENEGEGE